MHFTHDPYQPNDTIAAIATPPGEGGVAVIRISGAAAIETASRVFSGPVKKYASHTVHYGFIKNSFGEKIDQVLIVVMKAPRSFTGEDTVEVHCHGGSVVTRRVLETILQAGARAAKPGEFTFKAFINGKIDLAQAEAVQQLISAKSDCAYEAAMGQLQGTLTEKVARFQDKLTYFAAILEAWVDFPEEDIEFSSIDEICLHLEAHLGEMKALADTFHDGRILFDGLSLCLVGSPNVGKSSLMNALLDKERAIVSPIPGTTRDLVEDHWKLNGLHLKLVDTAGIRVTDECIEQEGIRRSKETLDQSDLVLLVLDGNRELEPHDRELIASVPPHKTIVIWNKCDLSHHGHEELSLPHRIVLSAKHKIGIEELKEKISAVIWEKGPPSKDEVLITKIRHHEALLKAMEACRRVIEGLQGQVSPEFVSMDMRMCLSELGKIIGTHVTEDILDSIFSQFCIGK